MRGTPVTERAERLRRRIIPAHAGNSRPAPRPGPVDTDHPRACGELQVQRHLDLPRAGSSPRMRGTLGHDGVHHLGLRIIPAHAGNSLSAWKYRRRRSDHPRACGELAVIWASVSPCPGSSPRMRGTLADDLDAASPHRIIPAHAGNSGPSSDLPTGPSDHPRACGELVGGNSPFSCATGSSPRMRGTLVPLADLVRELRIIPAHAGNSSSFFSASSRISGSSPRMRGTQHELVGKRLGFRIIPAHAGNSHFRWLPDA